MDALISTDDTKIKKKVLGFSLQANYTDQVTAAFRRSQCQLLWTGGVAWSAQQISTAVNFGFLDWSPYFLK
jgi:hypothetical protein